MKSRRQAPSRLWRRVVRSWTCSRYRRWPYAGQAWTCGGPTAHNCDAPMPRRGMTLEHRGSHRLHGRFSRSKLPANLPAPGPAFGFPRRFRGLRGKDSTHFPLAEFPQGDQRFSVVTFRLGLGVLPGANSTLRHANEGRQFTLGDAEPRTEFLDEARRDARRLNLFRGRCQFRPLRRPLGLQLCPESRENHNRLPQRRHGSLQPANVPGKWQIRCPHLLLGKPRDLSLERRSILPSACLLGAGAVAAGYAAISPHRISACSRTVCVAFSCLSGGYCRRWPAP